MLPRVEVATGALQSFQPISPDVHAAKHKLHVNYLAPGYLLPRLSSLSMSNISTALQQREAEKSAAHMGAFSSSDLVRLNLNRLLKNIFLFDLDGVLLSKAFGKNGASHFIPLIKALVHSFFFAPPP